MKIVTWNINGVRARIGNLLHWLRESAPDIVCLQEIKTVDEGFPRAEVEALGYNVETNGQKGFNGVAILSKLRFDEVNRGLSGDDADEQARFIEGVFSTDKGALRVASLYLPNGNPIDDEKKFPYKLAWMARLESWAAERLKLEEALVLAGDYNVIPEPADAKYPENWVNDALFQPATRQAFRRLEESSASPKPSAPSPIQPMSSPSGTTRPAPGRRTTASASTTCCFRPKPPTASSRRRWRSTCGPGKSRRTTFRSRSNWLSPRLREFPAERPALLRPGVACRLHYVDRAYPEEVQRAPEQPHLVFGKLLVRLGDLGHVPGEQLAAVRIEFPEHRDRLRPIRLVAEIVEILDDAVEAVVADAEGVAADAAEHLHLAVLDDAVGKDHAEQEQKLGRQHGIVGDLADARISLEQVPQLRKQTCCHLHPLFCRRITRNPPCANGKRMVEAR